MSRYKTTTLSPENKIIHETAIQNACWIVYNNTWYTTGEFVQKLGNVRLNLQLLSYKNPRKAMEEGRQVVIKMINEDRSKEDIIKAFNRLSEFTDKVHSYAPVIHV